MKPVISETVQMVLSVVVAAIVFTVVVVRDLRSSKR